ncbi:MAG: preprotein translocase subunit SecE [Candidatus Brocadiia bacterium]
MAVSVYKKGQGTAARGIAGLVAVLLGTWAAHRMWYYGAPTWPVPLRGGLTALVALLFGGVPLCLVLFHRGVVDLLIETQQEMRKVAWSPRHQVVGSTVIVVVTVVLLSLFIFVTDYVVALLNHFLGLY